MEANNGILMSDVISPENYGIQCGQINQKNVSLFILPESYICPCGASYN